MMSRICLLSNTMGEGSRGWFRFKKEEEKTGRRPALMHEGTLIVLYLVFVYVHNLMH